MDEGWVGGTASSDGVAGMRPRPRRGGGGGGGGGGEARRRAARTPTSRPEGERRGSKEEGEGGGGGRGGGGGSRVPGRACRADRRSCPRWKGSAHGRRGAFAGTSSGWFPLPQAGEGGQEVGAFREKAAICVGERLLERRPGLVALLVGVEPRPLADQIGRAQDAQHRRHQQVGGGEAILDQVLALAEKVDEAVEPTADARR